MRLEIAATVAPVLRATSEKTKSRRVKLVNANGDVVGESTMGEVLKGLAQEYAIEHTLADPKMEKKRDAARRNEPERVKAQIYEKVRQMGLPESLAEAIVSQRFILK